MITFYQRREWQELRYKVLRNHDFKCMACNNKNKELHVDHIKPKSVYPELALVESNLQVLCKDCNLGKSNKYCDNFKPKPRRALTDDRYYLLNEKIKTKLFHAEKTKDEKGQILYLKQYLKLQKIMGGIYKRKKDIEARRG